ncbi:MAG: helix-turn-helix transcriptional regulator [Fimbriimonadaceae bacterium]
MRDTPCSSPTAGVLLTIPHAMRVLGVSRSQIYRMFASGVLETVKIGVRGVRIRSADVERIVREGARPREGRW